MKSGSKLALGAVVGAAVGIAAGILTAPKSGKETREDVLKKVNNAKDSAALKKDDAVFKTEELIDDIRLKAQQALESIKKRDGSK